MFLNKKYEEKMINYFKEQGAVSEEKAISMHYIDWATIGFTFFKTETKDILKKYDYMKQNKNGKVWIDFNKKGHAI